LQENENIKTKIDFSSQAFKKYFTNTSWLLAERIIRLVISFVVNIYVIRYLGPNDFGLLSYAISFAALFATLSTLGLDSLIIRELVKEPEKRDTYLGSVFVMKIFGSVASYILIAATVLLTNESSFTILLILLISASTLFQSFNVVDFYFQSKVLAKFSVIVQFTTAMLMAGIRILLIQIHAELWLFALAVALESAFWAVGFMVVYKKQGLKILNWKFNKETAFQLIKDSWPLILSGIAVSIYMRIDQVMIKKMLNDQEVGYYAAAVRISEAWYFIPMVITTSLFPAIVNAKKTSEILYMNRLQKLYDLLAWMSIVIAIPVTIFSGTIVKLLLGPQYSSSADVLTVYIWAGVSVFLGVGSSQYLITENLTKLAFYRTFTGMIFNVILNFILIPKIGIVGAAIATLVSYTAAVFSIGFDRKAKDQLIMLLNSIFFVSLFRRFFVFVQNNKK
jgi:O-antigen/teichoic acid export membrane protein